MDTPPTGMLLEMNRRRPRDLSDFDKRPGLLHLVHREAASDQSVWTPSWWVNITCLLIASGLTAVIMVPFAASETLWGDLLAQPLWTRTLAALAGLFAAATSLYLALCGINRCRFVIDKTRSELRFTYGLWFWQRFTLSFADIRAVKSRIVETVGIDDGPAYPHRVVFVELHSGELVLIAIDADFRHVSLFREIKQALESYPFQETERRPLLLV